MTKSSMNIFALLEKIPPPFGAGYKFIFWINVFFQKHVIQEMKKALFFSWLADETTGILIKEQLVICVRCMKDRSICKCFFAFQQASDLTGATKLLLCLGVKTRYRNTSEKSPPTAMYMHWISHCFNLYLTKAGQVACIEEAVTLMHNIAVLYYDSTKQTGNLQEAIKLKC